MKNITNDSVSQAAATALYSLMFASLGQSLGTLGSIFVDEAAKVCASSSTDVLTAHFRGLMASEELQALKQ